MSRPHELLSDNAHTHLSVHRRGTSVPRPAWRTVSSSRCLVDFRRGYPDGAVDFNQDERPRYTDFAYLNSP